MPLVIDLEKKGLSEMDDVEEMRNLTGISKLILSQNDFNMITPFNRAQCESLIYLDVRVNKLLCISNLESLVNLTHLYLSTNCINKIENLSCLVNLVYLDLSNNLIPTIEGLDTLVRLEKLYLQDNLLSTIENLETLTKLKLLALSENKIRRWQNLETLVNLKWLFLTDNDLTTLKDATLLPKLKILMLDKNDLSTIMVPTFKDPVSDKNMSVFPNLRFLSLKENMIEDIKEVKKLRVLEKLVELNLERNPALVSKCGMTKEDVDRIVALLPKIEKLDERAYPDEDYIDGDDCEF